MACRLDSRVVSVGVWQVQYDLTDEYPEANDEFVKKEDYFRRVTPPPKFTGDVVLNVFVACCR